MRRRRGSVSAVVAVAGEEMGCFLVSQIWGGVDQDETSDYNNGEECVCHFALNLFLFVLLSLIRFES